MVVGSSLVTKSCPTLVTPWTIVHQAPLSMGFPGKNTRVREERPAEQRAVQRLGRSGQQGSAVRPQRQEAWIV